MNNEAVQRQLYGVAIFEEEIVLSDFSGDGEQRFIVSPEQLMGFFRTSITFRPFPGLIWMKDDGTARRYLLALPAGERTILYRRRKKLLTRKLRLPAMAALVTIASAGGHVQSLQLWGFSGSTLKPGTILYDLPLPNLANGNLCLGGSSPIVGDDIRAGVEAALFDSPFNHHNDVVGRERLSFYDYHRKYKGAVPLRSLKPLATGRKILEDQR